MAHSSWGPGWPNCQTGAIVKDFNVDGIYFPGGIRGEIAELVTRLVRETRNRGYVFGVDGNPSYGCWGFSCRAISGTRSASNHSWGLAVDINAPRNPYGGSLVTDMPSWMPELWNAYGFRWGGTYSGKKDAMHYEFIYTTTDAANYTALARQNNLGGGSYVAPQPPATGGVPPFPFPTGHWMGVESNNPKNHSGYYQADRPGIKQYQSQMAARGWKISVDGGFGPQSRDVTIKYQREKGLAADGLAGEQTWHSIWTAPVT